MTDNQTNQKAIEKSVSLLSEFLDLLYPDPGPDIITLADFKLRYRLTKLGEPAVRALEQAQRVNRAIGDFENTGLCEFHIGLFFLNSGECRTAAQQFQTARQQWSFVDKTAAVCLSYFAEGLALHHSFSYESALEQFGRAERNLNRIIFEPSPVSRDQYLEKMTISLVDVQKETRKVLWNKDAEPPDIAICEGCVWYRVEEVHDNALTSIETGTWLVVNTQIAGHDFKEEELVVVLKRDVNEPGIVLKPYEPKQLFPRIYLLARTQFTGRFVRDINTGNVTLLSNDEQIPIQYDEILGLIVGWYSPILP